MTPGWVIREAQEEDAPAMLEYARILFSEPDLYLPWEPDEFRMTRAEEEAAIRRHHETANAVFLLAFDPTGSIAGMWNAMGSARRALEHNVEFGMSVARPFRRQGVGRALMTHGLKWAKANPLVRRVELHVYADNTPAVALYQTFGFVVEGRRQHAVFQHGRTMTTC